jgi:methylglutaconyl-CoA hydratase
MEDILLVNNDNPGIALLTLNRPEKRNALNTALIEALTEQIETLSKSKDKRVIIVTGAGIAFCSGLDLQEGNDEKTIQKQSDGLAKLLKLYYECPLITIAAVNGHAIAGGAGIFLASDFTVAVEGARVGFPEVRRGLVAALVLSLLRRKTNENNISKLLFLAENIDVAEAKSMQMINDIVPPRQLMNWSLDIANQILKGAPGAIARTKHLMQSLYTRSLDEDIDICLKVHVQARQDKESHEGIAAFLEKRQPVWCKCK